jgi:cytochrome c
LAVVRAATIAMLVLCLLSNFAAAANPAAGQTVFSRCRICHTVEAGKPSLVGPNLHGVFGRKAGTLDGYAYSEAMRSSGIVWSDETLAKYLTDPKTFIPGNRMAFPGIKDENELADLLAYLRQAAQ